MTEQKHKLPEVVRVLITTALVTASIVSFGAYLFWIKPLHDELKASDKETTTLKEQVDLLVHDASVMTKVYANDDLGFSFEYKDSYEVATNFSSESSIPGTFAELIKKDDVTKTPIVFLALQKNADASLVNTDFPDKVVKSETKVGKTDLAATSFVFLPGRGSEFAASLHVVKIIVPLKKNSDQSLVLTNIGDADLSTFQAVVASLQITK